GSRHYLLKSELRSADLIRVLQELDQERNSIVASIKEDHYANGFIDFYNLYQNAGNTVFIEDFCTRTGRVKNVPFLVLAYSETELGLQKQQLDDLLARHEYGGSMAGLRGSIIFLVLQVKAGQAPGLLAEQLAGQLAKGLAESLSTPDSKDTSQAVAQFAIGSQQSSLASILQALTEAELLLQAGFFKPSTRVIKVDDFRTHTGIDGKAAGPYPVDRDRLRQAGLDILACIDARQFDKATSLLDQWFRLMDAPVLDDTAWLQDRVSRMMNAFDERLQAVETGPGATTILPRNLASARTTALQLVESLRKAWLQGSHRGIQLALDYIHAHYAETLSLVEVASHACLSPEYFSRLFKDKTGENFSVYLMMYRLEQARLLIRTSDLKIYEIAEAVGYSTPSYFSKQYREYMGLSPEAERQDACRSHPDTPSCQS
ncbi:MAG: AraC family transcriptional regulator, partial [Spirochaetota bacterium]